MSGLVLGSVVFLLQMEKSTHLLLINLCIYRLLPQPGLETWEHNVTMLQHLYIIFIIISTPE